MAMAIFFILNGMGVVFLLYVLASFWEEGHPRKNRARKYAAEFRQCDRADVIVATHPNSIATQRGISVMAFQTRQQEHRDKPSRGMISRGTIEVPVRRTSAR
jgi:hypothetical protein